MATAKRRPFVSLVAVALPLFLVATVAKLTMGKGKALFVSDGFYYYCYTVSLALDRDLDFSNQYRFNKGLANRGFMAIVPKTGRPRNVFAIGAGLMWLPGFLIAHLCVLALKALGLPLTTTGFEVYYQLPTYLWSFLIGLIGMVMVYHLLRVISGDEMLAVWTTAVSLFGTTVSVYAFLHCNFVHWVSVAAVAACLWAAFYLAQHPKHPILWLFAGFALGGAALVRWQSAALGLLFCGAAWQLARERRFVTLAAHLTLCLIGTVLVFSPQLLAWHLIFDSWLTIPQGKDYMHWTSPRLLYTLFSLQHGLFVWSPIYLMAVWGLFQRHPKVDTLRWSILLALAAQVYVNSITGDFAGFGLRRMVDYAPLFAVGLMMAFARLKTQGQERFIPILSGAAIALNWLIIIGVHLTQWLQRSEFHML